MKTSIPIRLRAAVPIWVTVALFLFLTTGIALAQDANAVCQSLGFTSSLTYPVVSGDYETDNGELFLGVSVNAGTTELAWASYDYTNAQNGPDGIPVGAVLITGTDGSVAQYDYNPPMTYAGGLTATLLDAITTATFCYGGNVPPPATITAPTIVSDQEDYLPGSLVTLTGTNWQPYESVHIFVNDDASMTWSWNYDVTATPDGTFVVQFNLPWWFVAYYSVIATGVSGTATTTFTDAALPSNVKLEQWETTPSGNWVTGNLGSSNSNYAEGETVPFRLDVGGNSFTNGTSYTFSICRQYQNGTKRGYLFLAPYNTSRAPVVGGSITSTSGFISGVNVTITGVNEIGGQGACMANHRETQVTFTSSGASTAYVLWGGHLASPADAGVGAGNGAASFPGSSLDMRLLSPAKTVSINPGAIIELATITVQKVVDSGTATPDQWCFNISPNPNGETLPKCPASGGDTVTFLGLPTGNYTITETTISGYAFASGTGSSPTCTFSGSTATAAVTAAITPTNATCVFHNAQQQGTIIIEKQTNPDGDTTVFDFDLSYGDFDADLADGQTDNSGSLVPGTYSVSENTPAGWDLTSAVCVDNDGNAQDEETPNNITLAANETVTCTFTNTQRGQIIVDKVTNPVGSSEEFEFDPSWSDTNFSLADETTPSNSGFLVAGAYSVSETAVAGWDLTGLTCQTTVPTGDTTTTSLGTGIASIDLDPGETVTCTFTNTQRGHIIVDKVTNPAGHAQSFAFDATGNGYGDFNLTDATLPNDQELVPGNYSVSETVPAGWALTSAVCTSSIDDDEEPESIELDAGETVTCTFTNTKYDLIVSKTAVTSWVRTYTWDITKDVTPTSANGFLGATVPFNYEVNVNQTVAETDYRISGTITVGNPSPFTVDFTVTDVIGGSLNVDVECPTTTLLPNDSTVCTYSTLVDGPEFDGLDNVATVTSQTVQVSGGSDEALITWSDEPTTVVGNPTVDVTDDADAPFTDRNWDDVAADAEFDYTQNYVCSSNPADYAGDGHYSVTINNTAAIIDPADSDNASVTVNCYAPVVNKTASGAYNELHTWELGKSVDPETQDAFIGETVDYSWLVTVNETVTENSFAVTGNITIKNPHPSASMMVAVADELNDAGTTDATINSCSNGTLLNGNVTIAANTMATCSYTANPNGRSADTNNATVTFNDAAFTATDAIEWTANIIDPVANLDDNQNPNLPPTVDGDAAFPYAEQYQCSTDPDDYDEGFYQFSETNTATLTRINGTDVDDPAVASTTVNCYMPVVSKTAAGTYNELHTWDINKTVSPTSQSGFAGDVLPYTWTVTLTEVVSENTFVVTGDIVVKNPNPSASMTVALADELNDDPATVATILSCTNGTLVGSDVTIAANTTATCSYTATASDRTATANDVITTFNSIDFEATASVGWTANVINPTVTVADEENTDDFPVDVSDGDTWTFAETYTCSRDLEDYAIDGIDTASDSNVATVSAVDVVLDSDDATANFTCYIPEIEKTATGTYDQNHVWDVTKTVNPTAQSGFAGDPLSWTWTVNVSEVVTESNFDVAGTITVTNPNSEDVLEVNLSDVLSDTTVAVISASATCDYDADTDTLTVAAGDTATCAYTASDLAYSDSTVAATLSNTATMTLNGIPYAANEAVVWTANISNGDATLTDNQAPLDEDLAGHADPGTYEFGPFQYADNTVCSTTISDYGQTGNYSVTLDNTAIVTGTDGQSNDADASTTYTCYIPTINKTATGTYDQNHVWDVTKTVDPTAQSGFAGDPLSWTWTVNVSEVVTESNFDVAGTITVTNPNSEDVLEVNLSDVLSDTTVAVISASATCDYDADTDTLTVAAGDTATCAYTASDLAYSDSTVAATLSNTATMMLNGIPYAANEAVVWTANISNGDATLTDNQAPLDEDLVGHADPGTYEFGPFQYADDAICSTTLSDYGQTGNYSVTLDNKAIVTGSNGQTNDADASTTYTCYIPTISKTATGTYDQNHVWDVTKTVNPTAQSGFAGDPLSWTWTVNVSEVVTESNFDVAGTITVTNPNSEDVLEVSLSDVLSDDTEAVISASATCDYDADTDTLTVAAGDTATCAYTASDLAYSDSTVAATLSNTATMMLNGIPYAANEAVVWTANISNGDATLTDNQAPLDEDLVGHANPGTYEFGPFQYADDAICSTTLSDYGQTGNYSVTLDNKAIVTGTDGQSNDADASTTYTCYIPTISKTATGTYDQNHVWDVTKTVDPTSQSGFAGDPLSWTWTVNVSEVVSESNFDVAGTITVTNPNSEDVLEVSLSDVLSDNTEAVISASDTCDYDADTDTLTVAAGDTATCAYTASDLAYSDSTVAATLSNTATMTLNGISYAANEAVVWTANVSNGDATLTDNQAPLDEDLAGHADPGTYNFGPFQYADDAICSTTLSDYGQTGNYSVTLDNKAIVTGSNGQSNDAEASTTYTCYIPTISKTAAGTYVERHEWDVNKTVSPTSQSGFAGATLPFNWTITVDETIFEETFAVTGTITVGNPNPEDVLEVNLSDVIPNGTVTIANSATCNYVAGKLTVATGGTATCAYSATVAVNALASAPTVNTASFSLNSIAYSATDAIEWTPTVIRGTATLDDIQYPYNDHTVDDNFSVTYPDSYTCSSDPADYRNGADLDNIVSNTAEVFSDGESQDSSTATTEIGCYAPVVMKTAITAYTRQYNWDITKTGNVSTLNLTPGVTQAVNYTVNLIELAPTDSGWTVSGQISIQNPNPNAPMTVSVADSLVGAVINCGDGAGDTTVTVPASSSRSCTYTAALTGAINGWNTATVTINSANFNAKRYYSFGEPTVKIDECVIVKDDKGTPLNTADDLALGTICAGDTQSRTFTYSMNVGPYTMCGNYTFTNTVRFETVDDNNDTTQAGSDDHTVTIVIPCDGCTRTYGYWKNHSLRGPAFYDDTWAVLDAWYYNKTTKTWVKGNGVYLQEREIFFKSGVTYYQVLGTNPRNNPYYILAHQYIAAELNFLNSTAPTPQVLAAFNTATNLFQNFTPSQVSKLKGSARNVWIDTARILDAYNNGLIAGGPGHCG